MKSIQLRALFVGALAIAALGLSACGSSFNCSDKGKCSKDVAPTSAEIGSCTQLINSKCGDKFKAYGSCFRDNEQCKADGTTDGDATNQKCASQLGDVTACCTANPGTCTF